MAGSLSPGFGSSGAGAGAGAGALSGRALRVTLGGRPILEGVSVDIPRGRVTAILGPNGSGKSTLLRGLSHLVPPTAGTVMLEGREIARMTPRERAVSLAVLPQVQAAAAGMTVRELVAHGRYPHRGLLGRLRAEDRAAIDWALHITGLEPFRDRLVDTLSGGERQRAWIAMALAQRTGILLLDEPTTYLDVRHQLEVLALARRLNREHGLTVVWVLHDLNQAAAYSDHIVLVHDGRIAGEGAPEDVLTPDTIRRVFGVDMMVMPHPRTGFPICLPLDEGAVPAALAREAV